MKKQKNTYCYVRYKGQPIQAKREISYEIKLSTRLLLDELCFRWNRKRLETAINHSIDEGNKQVFIELSKTYEKLF